MLIVQVNSCSMLVEQIIKMKIIIFIGFVIVLMLVAAAVAKLERFA